MKLHFFFYFRALYIEACYPFIPIPINYIRPSKVIDVVICHSQMEAESWISCHRMRIDQRMNDSTYKINTVKIQTLHNILIYIFSQIHQICFFFLNSVICSLICMHASGIQLFKSYFLKLYVSVHTSSIRCHIKHFPIFTLFLVQTFNDFC